VIATLPRALANGRSHIAAVRPRLVGSLLKRMSIDLTRQIAPSNRMRALAVRIYHAAS